MARRAARAEPALRRAERRGAAFEVRRFFLRGLVGRNDMLRPAMRRDRLPGLGDRPQQRGIALGDNAARIPDRAYLLGGEQVEQAPRSGLGAVLSPRARL